jgi:hypothetical protein
MSERRIAFRVVRGLPEVFRSTKAGRTVRWTAGPVFSEEISAEVGLPLGKLRYRPQ